MDLEFLDELWKSRHQSANLSDLERLLDSHARETQNLEARYEIDWRRARLCHFAAMQAGAAGDEKSARAHFERGADFAEWTREAQPQRVEGRFWWAVGFLEAGRMGGKWAAYWALRAPNRSSKPQPRLTRVSFSPRRCAFWAASRTSRHRVWAAGLKRGTGSFRARARNRRQFDNAALFRRTPQACAAESGAKTQFEAILAAPDDENWKWEQARDRVLAAKHLGR
jgi:hypothetical protein